MIVHPSKTWKYWDATQTSCNELVNTDSCQGVISKHCWIRISKLERNLFYTCDEIIINLWNLAKLSSIIKVIFISIVKHCYYQLFTNHHFYYKLIEIYNLFNIINRINKEKRRLMNVAATPTWPDNKNQWQGAQTDQNKNRTGHKA
jgi:hypothetical protein